MQEGPRRLAPEPIDGMLDLSIPGFGEVHFVARGGSAVVYRARHQRDGVDAAVKVFPHGDPRHRRETAAMRKLAGVPGVVPVLDEGVLADGRPWLAMPFAELGSTERLMEAGPLLPDVVAGLGAQAADALAGAHAVGIVHCDVKPSNLLLDSDGRVLLSDFGIAHCDPTADGPDTMSMTLLYTAPEVLGGERPDERSDIYSLGLTLLALLGGVHPFEEATASGVAPLVARIVSGPPPDVPAPTPAWMAEVIARCTALVPNERYVGAADVAVALRTESPHNPDQAPGGTASKASSAHPHGRIDASGGSGTPANAYPRSLTSVRSGTFVGRSRELAWISEAFTAAVVEGPLFVPIAGEPGIGKTRLVAEATSVFHGSGATILAGRCTTQPIWPFEPFADAARSLPAVDPNGFPTATHLGRLLARFEEFKVHSSRRPHRPTATGDDRGEFLDELVRLFVELTRHGPAVLVLEDLHWATSATLDALRMLVRSPDRIPLLVLCTYRDTDVAASGELSSLVFDLARESDTRLIQLEGLGEPALSTWIDSSGSSSVRATEASVVLGRTNGNPLFVKELLRHIEQSPGDPDVPPGVGHLISRRIDALGGDVPAVLRCAAVLGQRFPFVLLRAMCALDDSGADVIGALESAVEARLVVEDRGTEPEDHSFSHALVQQAILDGLSTPRRTALHDLARRAIEEVYGDAPRWVGSLARHALAAIDAAGPEVVVRNSVLAARLAFEQFAYEEAVAFAESGLRVLDEYRIPTGGRAELTYYMAATALWEATNDHGLTLLHRTLDFAREEADAVTFARAAIDLMTASTRWGVGRDGGTDIVEEALGMLGEASADLRVELVCELAYYAGTCMGDLPEGRRLSDEALVLAQATASPDTLLVVKGYWEELRWDASVHEERRAVGAEMRELGERSGTRRLDHERMYEARLRFELADPSFRNVLHELEASAQRGLEWRGLLDQWRGFVSLVEGAFVAAERHNTSALDRLRRPNNIASALAQLCLLRREQGRPAEALPMVEAALDEEPESPGYLAARALFLAELGDADHAREALQVLDVDHDTHSWTDRPTWTVGAILAAEVAARTGDQVLARSLQPVIQPLAGTLVVAGLNGGCAGSADRALGQLAATTGDHQRAVSHYRTALALESQVGAPVSVARTRFWWAQFLAGAGAGEARAAAEQAAEAKASAERLGMRGLALDCEALARG